MYQPRLHNSYCQALWHQRQQMLLSQSSWCMWRLLSLISIAFATHVSAISSPALHASWAVSLLASKQMPMPHFIAKHAFYHAAASLCSQISIRRVVVYATRGIIFPHLKTLYFNNQLLLSSMLEHIVSIFTAVKRDIFANFENLSFHSGWKLIYKSRPCDMHIDSFWMQFQEKRENKYKNNLGLCTRSA